MSVVHVHLHEHVHKHIQHTHTQTLRHTHVLSDAELRRWVEGGRSAPSPRPPLPLTRAEPRRSPALPALAGVNKGSCPPSPRPPSIPGPLALLAALLSPLKEPRAGLVPTGPDPAGPTIPPDPCSPRGRKDSTDTRVPPTMELAQDDVSAW